MIIIIFGGDKRILNFQTASNRSPYIVEQSEMKWCNVKPPPVLKCDLTGNISDVVVFVWDTLSLCLAILHPSSGHIKLRSRCSNSIRSGSTLLQGRRYLLIFGPLTRCWLRQPSQRVVMSAATTSTFCDAGWGDFCFFLCVWNMSKTSSPRLTQPCCWAI